MTEVEMKEKKDRVEDALHATRAALEEGILPGGGVAYLKTVSALKSYILSDKQESVDTILGFQIVMESIKAPFRKILSNAGEEELDIELTLRNIVENTDNKWEGYNPRVRQMVNLKESGIVDPTKVTRLALENAASVAGTLLITECVVVSEETKEKDDQLTLGDF
jgi:chaperonin GroEL